MKFCSSTVLDSDIQGISFDENGVSNFAQKASWRLENESFWNSDPTALENLAEKIRSHGRKSEYDCLIGLSGGVDSSYVAHLVVKLGLKPLALHVDNGWNTEIAVSNIEQLVEKLGLDLITVVLPWREVKDLQRAYIKAGVMDLECVADHAIGACTYRLADEYNIKYIVNGGNVANEALLPIHWGFDKRDDLNLKDIHGKNGSIKLRDFPTQTLFQLGRRLFFNGLKTVPILNYTPFSKKNATDLLQSQYGWKSYGRKHGENRFTRFYQEIYLPEKFNIDKRKAHLSNQILNGELSRNEAFKMLEDNIINIDERRIELKYVAKKLGFSFEELEAMLVQAGVPHTKYKHYKRLLNQQSFWVQFARYLAKGEFKNATISKLFRATQNRL